jgi:hypothetical protein
MAKHAEELMSPEEFAAGVELSNLRLGYFLTHPRSSSSHPLKQIHRRLGEYHGKPKSMLSDRHRLLGEMIDLCDYYVGSKPARKQTSRKANTVLKLANQSRTRLLTEQTRASALEQELNKTGSGAQVGSGGFNKDLRFERLAKPGGIAVKGDALKHTAAQGTLGPVQLTGDDVNDYYALKKLLKTLDPAKVRGAGLEVLEYLSEEERAEYEVDIDVNRFWWAGTANFIDTLSNLSGDPPRTCMYACDLNGRFYARNYEGNDHNRASFCHSSFLAGDNCLCAGTMKIANGRLLEITNLSGHYTPKYEHLVDACQAILVGRLSPQGYDPGQDGYVVFGDMSNTPTFPVTSGKQTQFYRFPLRMFAQKRQRITNFMDYECVTHLTAKQQNGLFSYTNPSAAVKAGCSVPTV